jgi:DNA-binding MarR family transcriptional regulator
MAPRRGATGHQHRPEHPDALLDTLDDLSIEVVALTALALAQGGQERDLTLAQWRALVLIASTDGVRASELAARIGASRPSMSRLIRRLAEKGLIRSATDPSDGRAVILSSTAVGRQALQDTRIRRRAMVAEALARHGQPLPSDLQAGLRAIVDALDGAM